MCEIGRLSLATPGCVRRGCDSGRSALQNHISPCSRDHSGHLRALWHEFLGATKWLKNWSPGGDFWCKLMSGGGPGRSQGVLGSTFGLNTRKIEDLRPRTWVTARQDPGVWYFVRYHLALEFVCGADSSWTLMCGASSGDLRWVPGVDSGRKHRESRAERLQPDCLHLPTKCLRVLFDDHTLDADMPLLCCAAANEDAAVQLLCRRRPAARQTATPQL